MIRSSDFDEYDIELMLASSDFDEYDLGLRFNLLA